MAYWVVFLRVFVCFSGIGRWKKLHHSRQPHTPVRPVPVYFPRSSILGRYKRVVLPDYRTRCSIARHWCRQQSHFRHQCYRRAFLRIGRPALVYSPRSCIYGCRCRQQHLAFRVVHYLTRQTSIFCPILVTVLLRTNAHLLWTFHRLHGRWGLQKNSGGQQTTPCQ